MGCFEGGGRYHGILGRNDGFDGFAALIWDGILVGLRSRRNVRSEMEKDQVSWGNVFCHVFFSYLFLG